VLGVANLALMFLNRGLAYEQQQYDKAALNLDVLRKQVGQAWTIAAVMVLQRVRAGSNTTPALINNMLFPQSRFPTAGSCHIFVVVLLTPLRSANIHPLAAAAAAAGKGPEC
jgi:hypothetical protein